MSAGHVESEVSRHKCLIYEGEPVQQLPVVLPLLLDGLATNWRCLYLGDPATLPMVDQALNAKGIDTEREQSRGALVLSADRSHLVNGRFDPEAMIDGLSRAIDESVEQGFEGLCATGDMRWELGDDSNFDRLLEYEARLEQLFREGRPLRGICQYRRDVVPPQALRHALMAHRSTYIGNTLNRDNLFYMPPQILLEGPGAEAQAEWMCQQIIRIMKAEEQRDEVLHSLERRVAERTKDLEEANRSLEAFAYSVSHDLRAPLRAIGGFSQILEEDFSAALGAEGMLQLERVQANVRKMSALIDGMLALSRVMKREVQRQPVNLTDVAEDVAQELRESAPDRVADWVIHRELHVVGDPTLLRALLVNLMGNAWKFTARRERTRIEVGSLAAADGGTVFYVRDNGAGFDLALAEKLFAPFQRFHAEQEFAGTGVGLATVHRIVTRHGGRIWAESAVNEGATFYFTL
jgi:signal transduction histidine kinase